MEVWKDENIVQHSNYLPVYQLQIVDNSTIKSTNSWKRTVNSTVTSLDNNTLIHVKGLNKRLQLCMYACM